MTLEAQYKLFVDKNPKSNLSFKQWEKVNSRLIKQAIINITKKESKDERTKFN
jgi:hypothetical protein